MINEITTTNDDGVPTFMMADETIARLTSLVHAATGMELDDGDSSFLIARLSARMRALGIKSYDTYCDFVEGRGNHAERRHFVAAVTTNTTSFFREAAHYRWLSERGIDLCLQRGVGLTRPLVIWSAACASGQELYSALIVARGVAERSGRDLRVRGVGTDVSAEMISHARKAFYQSHEIAGLTPAHRRDYLVNPNSGDGRYQVVPELRLAAEWREANLLRPQTIGHMKADIVFLRNILIYFNRDHQREILKTVISRLRPHGLLLTGHTESAAVEGFELESLCPSIFRKGE